MHDCTCTPGDAVEYHGHRARCPQSPRARQIRREEARLQAIEDGTLMDEPETRECRECGLDFRTRVARRGSKWGALCPSCLQFYV